MTNPVLVEVLRGGQVESQHRGRVAVVDAEGKAVLALGDVARPVFPRSAVKPLQALALVVGGADTGARQLTPESAGLYALATGFQAMAKDGHEKMTKQFPAYDTLYAYCRSKLGIAK